MKRRIISIEECLPMSKEELISFIDNDNRIFSEGNGNSNESNVDFHGLSIRK